MKKILGIIFILIGFSLCGFGTYDLFTSLNATIKNNDINVYNPPLEDSTNKYLRIMSSVTKEEKNEITTYLTNKYGGNFEVLEHTTRFCINQESDIGFKVDMACSGKEIVNDIFKVRDSNSLEFYVKKVTIKKGVIVKDDISSFQSNGLYDSYVIYRMSNQVIDTFKEQFLALGTFSSLEIYSGIGIEQSECIKSNNNYSGYSIYADLGQKVFDASDLDLPIESYFEKADYNSTDKILKIHVKYDIDLNVDNFQDIVKTIVENDIVNYQYDLIGSDILIEFNNKLFIDYSFNGESITLNKYDTNIMDSFSDRVYDKSIIINSSSYSTDSISYEEFMSLDKNNFNF